MTEPITASPELMRQVADEHDAIADLLDGARARAAQVQSAVQSWGNIMSQTKQAAAEVMARHDRALQQEAASHRLLAGRLRGHAAGFEQGDTDNAARIGNLL